MVGLVHSIVFHRSKWTDYQSYKWLMDNGFKCDDIDQTAEIFIFQQLSSKQLVDDGFNKLEVKHVSDGIDFLIACRLIPRHPITDVIQKFQEDINKEKARLDDPVYVSMMKMTPEKLKANTHRLNTKTLYSDWKRNYRRSEKQKERTEKIKKDDFFFRCCNEDRISNEKAIKLRILSEKLKERLNNKLKELGNPINITTHSSLGKLRAFFSDTKEEIIF